MSGWTDVSSVFELERAVDYIEAKSDGNLVSIYCELGDSENLAPGDVIATTASIYKPTNDVTQPVYFWTGAEADFIDFNLGAFIAESQGNISIWFDTAAFDDSVMHFFNVIYPIA